MMQEEEGGLYYILVVRQNVFDVYLIDFIIFNGTGGIS